MKKVILVALTLLPMMVQAKASTTVDCSRNPIFCDILTLKPSINRTYAMELSNYIYKWSKHYGTNPKYSIAIAMQESSFINQDRKGTVLTPDGRRVKGVTDIGVFQIHIETIEKLNKKLKWNIDFQRLRTDVEYQAEIHARLLRRKIRTCSQLSYKVKLKVESGDEWTCYHSYTYSARMKYKSDAGPYLDKILPKVELVEEN